MIKIIFLGVAALALITFVYYGARFMSAIQRSKVLAQKSVPFTLDKGPGFSMLVLGDSTAVGVGADKPEDSVPARVAATQHATHVENYGVSGAIVDDLPIQITEAIQSSYDLILVQIGGNDITRLHPAVQTARMLVSILKALPPSKQVVVISAGDVGAATIIPPFFRPIFTKLNLAYHAEFTKALTAEGYTYVNIHAFPDNYLFTSQPEIYLASDGFHPSSAGYGIWFNAIKPHLKQVIR